MVADIVRRAAPPDLAVVRRARYGAPTVGAHRLAGLLRCHCGQVLTGRRYTTSTGSGTEYYCARASRTPNHGRTVVREATLLPLLRAEGDRLQPPPEVIDTVAADEAARAALEAKRARVVEYGLQGVITKAEVISRLSGIDADRDAIGTRETILQVPKVDLDWAPQDVNAALRSMWSEVVLDGDLRPVRVEWLPGLEDWIRVSGPGTFWRLGPSELDSLGGSPDPSLALIGHGGDVEGIPVGDPVRIDDSHPRPEGHRSRAHRRRQAEPPDGATSPKPISSPAASRRAKR